MRRLFSCDTTYRPTSIPLSTHLFAMDSRDAELAELRELIQSQGAQLKKQDEQIESERILRELAESRAQQAQEERQRAEEQRQQAVDRTRRTTFTEMLQWGHKLSDSISVEKDKLKSTQGSTTSVKGKCCPTMILPWKEFPDIRQIAFNELYDLLHPPTDAGFQLFSPVLWFEEQSRLTSRMVLSSEEDLKNFHETAVETPIRQAISTLAAAQLHGKDWNFGQGVFFENHTNNLSDLGEEVQEALKRLKLANTSTKSKRSVKPIRADQLCVFKNTTEEMQLLFVIEYKAPHKIPKEILRAGLREMNIPNEVINRLSFPITDPSEKFQYNADKLVAAVATQTYSYMLESGCEYGCVITGEAIVFLWIKEDDSNTLYYHLAEPNEEVHTADGAGFEHPLTAIGQMLSFCILALQSRRRDQDWRDGAVKNAQTWTEDWEKMLRDIPEEQVKLEPPPSAYKPTRYDTTVRSPYKTRNTKLKSSLLGCSPEIKPTRDDQDDPDGDFSDGPESVDTPSKRGSGSKAGKGNGRSQDHGAQASSSYMKQRQYCTQACLLGLVRGTYFDESCPNTELHRQGRKRRTHLLNMEQFSELVRLQLGTSLDHNCKELGLQGARGALFKVTLASHGYTFVGKATPEAFVPDLRHEGRMYGLLRSIQGKKIPVYLGNIDLIKPWRDLHLKLIHMLLMSWGGETVNRVHPKRRFDTEIKQFETRLARLGVQHEDIRGPNMLWNEETGGVMFIDFERSIEIPSSALQEVSPNKKRKRSPLGMKTELGQQSQELVIWSDISKRSPGSIKTRMGNQGQELAVWSETTSKRSPADIETEKENRCQELILWSET